MQTSPHLFSACLLAIVPVAAQGALVWTVGMDDNAWPAGDGGGPNATFVQEAGTNPPPGNPNNPEVNQQADDDYYFAGTYSTVLPGNSTQWGAYAPAGVVAANEEAAERAFAGTDNDLRYHFNLAGVSATDLLTITFDALNLDSASATNFDLRHGIEIYFNGVLVQPEILIRPADVTAGTDFTTAPFSLASVGAEIGPGFDNIVYLKGINYNASGGGNWMGIDYVRLDSQPIPEPSTALMFLLGSTGLIPLLRRRR